MVMTVLIANKIKDEKTDSKLDVSSKSTWKKAKYLIIPNRHRTI